MTSLNSFNLSIQSPYHELTSRSPYGENVSNASMLRSKPCSQSGIDLSKQHFFDTIVSNSLLLRKALFPPSLPYRTDWWSAAEMVVLLEGSPLFTEQCWSSVNPMVTSLTTALLPQSFSLARRPTLGTHCFEKSIPLCEHGFKRNITTVW